MLKKGTKLYSIYTGNCPKCQSESMYLRKNPYSFEVLKMRAQCSHCELRYKIEPSFFYGAMYVSYAVGIVFGVAAFIVSYLLFSSSLKVAFISIVGTLLVFFPIILRLSRNIWINLFISPDKEIFGKY